MIDAQYFDGRSTRVHRVTLSFAGGCWVVAGEGVDRRLPFAEVTVDEKLGRAPRKLRFAGGAFCEVADLKALDALLAEAGHRDGMVDRLQRHVRIALLAVIACIALAFAAYRWGLPVAVEIGVRHLPPSVGKTLTVHALKALDGQLLLPSETPEDRQAEIAGRYRALHLPEGGTPSGRLLFRNSPALGANAFTLPDGTVVLLDGLIKGLADDEIMAVLSHELGHAHGRHGLQLLIRSSAIGAFLTFYLGDISQLLAAAPTVLIQAKYSRELEEEADQYGATLLEANGMSPALLADALEKLGKLHPGGERIPYLASHPATDDRIKALRQR
ncbi:MAG TPA: M48 family metallopeptidase [Magnetospirillaceae bacterium]|nr:M48 family metallopeptidase [Magnetospirillaceae bacterium]